MSESQKYTVVGLVDATVSEEVEASSPEEARDRASLYAGVCFQCASELEVGDVYDVQVLDEDGDVIIPFEADVEKAQLRAECARLQKMLDVCNVVHEHNMKLKDRTDHLLRRLQHVARLLDVDSDDPREDVLAVAVMRLRRGTR